MKKLIAIGLLLLLLYNILGLTIAMLFFENNYHSSSSIIFNDKWKIIKIPTADKDAHYAKGDQQGLIRNGNDFYNIMHEYHENDTLYVILKSNQNAQERFSELSSIIMGMANPNADAPQSTSGKILKLLGDLQKIYLSDEIVLDLHEPGISLNHPSFYTEPQQSDYQVIHLLHSPPPELA